MIKDRISLTKDQMIRDLTREWREMATVVNAGSVPVLVADSEPRIADGCISLWVDSLTGKYYLLAMVAGTQKKVELT